MSKLNTIAKAILSSLDTIQQQSIAIGGRLQEANELHETQKDFLLWAKENVMLGKSQVYKLMAINKSFAEDESFRGVAMNILYSMVTEKAYEGGENNELYLSCKVLACNGELTAGTYKNLLEPVEPVKVELSEEEKELQRIEREENKLKELQQTAQLVTTPHLETEEVNDEQLTGSNDKLIVEQPDTAKDELIEQQALQIEQLSQQLETLLNKVDKVSKQELPTLPHFRANSMPMRLGLPSNVRDAKKIKAAFRELVRLGYGTKHSAHELLKEAHDTLIAKLAK